MVTENAVSRHDHSSPAAATATAAAHQVRPDVPLALRVPRAAPLSPRSPLPQTSGPVQSPRLPPAPLPYSYEHGSSTPNEPSSRSNRDCVPHGQWRGRPLYRNPTDPVECSNTGFPAPYQQPQLEDRSNHRLQHNFPPSARPALRISSSMPRLNGRRMPNSAVERRPYDYGLALPRFPPPPTSSEFYGVDVVRSSVNSGITSVSSIEHASGTERSSVLTKTSSITDLSPDTPDDDDAGMSVEDAISMYLDGFSDVPEEEPSSPELCKSPAVIGVPSSPMQILDMPAEFDHQSVSDVSGLREFQPDCSQLELQPECSQPECPQPECPPNTNFALEESKIFVPGDVPPGLLPGDGAHDRYGFRKATHHITVDQYETWHTKYSTFAATRKAKWFDLLAENGLPTADPVAFPPKSSKIKRFVRKGIPAEHRGAAWFWYAGGHEYLQQNAGLYDKLAQSAMESPSNDDKEHIERDLHRTFPDNIHFKPEPKPASLQEPSGNLKSSSAVVETQMIRSLRRVLYAFSVYSSKIGYTQSLNFIAGMLLLFLPEEKAFWMLHIITSVYLPGTHEVSLEGANIDLWILMVLLRDSMPHVYSKIVSTTPPANPRSKPPALTVNSRLPDITLGLTNWLMSVFIGSLPLETTLRVWDVFFYEGSKTFFRVSLAIFKASERQILAVSDPMEVFQIVQTVPKALLDANVLLDESFVRRHRVGQSRIDELRSSRRAAVRQDKLRRSLAFGNGQLLSATTDDCSRPRTPLANSWRNMKQHAFR